MTRARSTPSSRAKRRTEGLACAPRMSGNAAPAAGGVMRCVASCAGAGAGAGAAVAGAGSVDRATGAAAVEPFNVATMSPALTRAPFATWIFATVPAAEDGTSIVALSVSSVTSGDSSPTVSPSLTRTSMTSTSLKSPRSGTRTSSAAGAAAGAFFEAGARRGLCGFLVGRLRGLDDGDRRALRDTVALLHRDLGDAAGRGRRHVHGRLVGLERDERRFDGDRIARLDQHLDDLDVAEIADVRHDDGGFPGHGDVPISSPADRAWPGRCRTS